MSPPPLTRSKHIQPFANRLRQAGTPVGPLLEASRLPADCLENGETLIPSASSLQFRELTARKLGQPNVALDVTNDLGLRHLGAYGRAMLGAPTLRKALEELCRLSVTQTTVALVKLKTTDDGDAQLSYSFQRPPESGFWQTDLYILQWAIKTVRLVEPNWKPTRIWLSSRPTPEHLDVIEQLRITPPLFGRTSSGFLVPSSMLALPVAGSESPLEASDEQDLFDSSPAETYAGAVRQVISTYATDHWLSIAEAAAVMGESTRTLQRRLQAENLSFSQIREQMRSEAAGRLLETTDIRLTDIACQLGYSSQGNFTRAFHRWAGVSPLQFRQQRRRAAQDKADQERSS